jgi:hypothetical protein
MLQWNASEDGLAICGAPDMWACVPKKTFPCLSTDPFIRYTRPTSTYFLSEHSVPTWVPAVKLHVRCVNRVKHIQIYKEKDFPWILSSICRSVICSGVPRYHGALQICGP